MPATQAADMTGLADLRLALVAFIGNTDIPDLSMRQLAVLVAAVAAIQPSTVRGLAATVGAPPTAVSRSLDRLVTIGLMVRERGPGGGSGWRAIATAEGVACVMQMRAALDEIPVASAA
jgi:DNA-binding MarR family transcriptional regulator